MSMTGIAFAVMFGGGVYLLANINNFAKDYAEKVASETLGVPVSIGVLDVDLKNRRARAKNLILKNVVGYSSPYLLRAQTVDVALGSISKAVVKFERIDVSGIRIWMDIKEGGSNVQFVQRHAQAINKAPQEGDMKVVIDQLALRGIGLSTSVDIAGTSESFDLVDLGDVSLQAIGARDNGVVAHDAIAQVWQAVSAQILASAPRQALIEGIKDKAVNKVRGFLDRALGE